MTEKLKIPLLVIVGPTAVGKSRVAVDISRQVEGEIISADSAQVYRYFNIGTAKPSPHEQRSVRHHLIDVVDADCQFSVADFQKMADEAIHDVHQRGRLPVLVGGTGLYIQAVIDRYVFSERGRDNKMRQDLAEIAANDGAEVLYKRLTEVDSISAEKIHPRNVRRVIRALEVYYSGNRPLSHQWAETVRRENPYRICLIGLSMGRELLYQRIEKRIEQMMKDGFLAEVQELIKIYSPECPGMQILGYRQLIQYIRGDISIEEALSLIKKGTRNLAKRQLTWFRRDKRINWLDLCDSDISLVIEKIKMNLEKLLKE